MSSVNNGRAGWGIFLFFYINRDIPVSAAKVILY
jgi:hypothetical protein